MFTCLSALVVGIAAALVWPPKYAAVATFVPEQTSSSRLPSSFGNLATQFGVSIGSDPQQSGRFYADLLLSRRVVERVLQGFYASTDSAVGSDSVTLLDLMSIRGRDSLERLQKGVKKLRAAMSVDPDIRTNVVTLMVTARDPYLAAAVANRFVEAVNEFNTRIRQSQAGRRRRFVEYEQNRLWSQSPALQYQLGQLQRQVDIEKEVYLTLRRNLETARIDEVNDLPLISVIDWAVPSRERKPSRMLVILASLVVGMVVSISSAYVAWYWGAARGRTAPMPTV